MDSKVNIHEKLQEIYKHQLDTDQVNQAVLYNAALSIKEVQGLVCEIGLRGGGGLALTMLACIENNDTNRRFLGVDPYGNIEYAWKQNTVVRFDYTNEMKLNTLKALSQFSLLHKLDFNFYCMEDSEFFYRFQDGVPFYSEHKEVINEYALVHLDGPHTTEALEFELAFFKPRISLGGYVVLDDVVGYYDLSKVESFLLEDESYEKVDNDGAKASYKRVK